MIGAPKNPTANPPIIATSDVNLMGLVTSPSFEGNTMTDTVSLLCECNHGFTEKVSLLLFYGAFLLKG